jgi:hypothetical protein
MRRDLPQNMASRRAKLDQRRAILRRECGRRLMDDCYKNGKAFENRQLAEIEMLAKNIIKKSLRK